jgi:hypothetical protein
MSNSEIEVVIFDGNINKTDYECLKGIYQEAFPDEEKLGSIDDLMNQAKSDNRFELDLIYSDPIGNGIKQLVAFAYNLVEKDFVYGIFIAIKKELRAKGYGKTFINYTKENLIKNKHFFFCAEKVEDTAKNKEQRIKREAFFHKLGFTQVETDIELNGVNFDFYSLNKVTPEEVDHYLDKIQETLIPDYYSKA